MTLSLAVGGDDYTNFTEASVSFSLDVFSREFSFISVTSQAQPLPFQGGERCQVFVNQGKTRTQVLDGFIEKIDVSYDANGHSISIAGRDKLGDFIDSSLETFEIQTEVSLKALIERVLSDLKYTGVEVIDNSGGIENFNPAEDKISASVGENAFEFIEKFARKRQVLLRTTNDGDIEIFRTQTDQVLAGADTALINRTNNFNNNILASSFSFDNSGLYNRYKMNSQLNVSSIFSSGTNDAPSIVDQNSEVLDRAIRTTRQLIIQPESNSSTEQCQQRAVWERDIRLSRQRVYSAVVEGFLDANNNIWDVNKLVNIFDDFSFVDARMLINTVTFNFDLSQGSTTSLGMVQKDSYTKSLEEPQKVDKVGENIFASA